MNLFQVLSPRRPETTAPDAQASTASGVDRHTVKARQTESGSRVAALPQVDIVEDAHGITLLADMPGVSKETLRVEVDGEVLTIEGDIVLDEVAELRVLHAEVRAPRYRRQFTLSRELDLGNIDASLEQGVLSITLPKLEEARPRRVEVRVA